ncbi:tautomerase family protein [Marinobacterium sp. D7]|uniref:tautomerase family protein n=1 Tax=Marinobacterium ramblicola TaxID=2849041 RepID=UPI001C2DB6C6|nr:tautomerase family protein [Marinobacterium ramblicola]
MASRLVCDRDYLAPAGRTEEMIIFQITAGRERSDATRNAFYARLVDELQASVGLRAADVMVIITTNRLSEWSFSGGISAGVQS